MIIVFKVFKKLNFEIKLILQIKFYYNFLRLNYAKMNNYNPINSPINTITKPTAPIIAIPIATIFENSKYSSLSGFLDTFNTLLQSLIVLSKRY